MHSYSFIKFDENFSNFEPNCQNMEKFKNFLEFISKDKDIKVITMKKFHEMYKEEPSLFNGSDYVPEVVVKGSLYSSLRRKINRLIKK